MKHKIPAIKSVMTAFPYWIAVDATLPQAKELMKERSVQHLPVKDEGSLVGVLTRSDLEQFELDNPADVKQSKVGDICVKKVYVVDMEEPLDNVLFHLANHHIGSALVTRNGSLAGLFTLNDASRCFGEFLRNHYGTPTGDGNDAA